MDQKKHEKREYAASKCDEKTKARVLAYMRDVIPEGQALRVPFKDIAQALGCSYGAVRYNVAKLYREGKIRFEDNAIRVL